MRIRSLLLSLLVQGVSLTALAEETSKEVTSYTFEDNIVKGDLYNPNGEVLVVHRARSGQSLVKAREHFVPEVLKSIENL